MAYLQQHVLLLGNHVHIVLKVVTAKVDGLNQYLLIAVDLNGRGREGERKRERERHRLPLRDAMAVFYLYLIHTLPTTKSLSKLPYLGPHA